MAEGGGGLRRGRSEEEECVAEVGRDVYVLPYIGFLWSPKSNAYMT